MSEKFSAEVKQRAVCEVVLGVASMTKVAERYGLSVPYLSILCSRFRRACGSEADNVNLKLSKKHRHSGSCAKTLNSRVEKLEKSVAELIYIVKK